MSNIGLPIVVGGGGVGNQPELLWTNPNPGNYFLSQTVTFSTGYDAYLVEFSYCPATPSYSVMYLPLGISYEYAYCVHQSTRMSNWYMRQIKSVSDGAIDFGPGSGPNGNASSHNDYAIPTRIWGVKWTI